CICVFFFFQAEDGIRDFHVTGVQTCALPICLIQPGWKALVDRAMAPNPGDRFHDARSLREALQGPELELELAELVSDTEATNARSEERRVGKEGRTRGPA